MELRDQAIHQRFMQVVEALKERGELVANVRKSPYSYSAFTEKVFGKPHSGLLSDYCKGKRRFYSKWEHLENLCKHYQVREDFMIRGEQPMFEDEDNEGYALADASIVELLPPIQSKNYVLPENTTQRQQPQIRFIANLGAVAGTALGAAPPEDFEAFHIPGLAGEGYVAFPVQGRSMQPTLQEDDILICREVSLEERLVDKDIYVVLDKEGSLVVKRIQSIKNNRKQLIGLKLISDNYMEYDPYELRLSEIRRIFKVERNITKL